MFSMFIAMILPRRRHERRGDSEPVQRTAASSRQRRRLYRVKTGDATRRAMTPAQNRTGAISTYTGDVPLTSRAVSATHRRMRGD